MTAGSSRSWATTTRCTDPSSLTVDNDKAVKWLQQGAQPTDRVRKLLEISGALEQFTASKPVKAST